MSDPKQTVDAQADRDADALLEAAFASLKSLPEPVVPDDALLARIYADAGEVSAARNAAQPVSARSNPPRRMALSDRIAAHWQALLGLTAVAAAGLVIGYSDPTGLAATVLGAPAAADTFAFAETFGMETGL
ncbi:MAG: hypothetical protein AAGJ96_06280 [Pseudomonadota bacterium]